ncbi:unnamed protein product, partial [Prorocentrum cordatum]
MASAAGQALLPDPDGQPEQQEPPLQQPEAMKLDEDVLMADEAPLAPPPPRRPGGSTIARRRAKAASDKAAAASAAKGEEKGSEAASGDGKKDGDEEPSDARKCPVCLLEVERLDPDTKITTSKDENGAVCDVRWHGKCRGAARYLENVARDQDKKEDLPSDRIHMSNLKKCEKENPALWRSKCMGLIVKTGGHRGVDMREKAVDYISEISQYAASETIRDVVMMDMDLFVGYHMANKRWSEDRAIKEFERLVDDGETEQDSDGEDCVPVRMPKKYRGREGRMELRSMHTKRNLQTPDEEGAYRKKMKQALGVATNPNLQGPGHAPALLRPGGAYRGSTRRGSSGAHGSSPRSNFGFEDSFSEFGDESSSADPRRHELGARADVPGAAAAAAPFRSAVPPPPVPPFPPARATAAAAASGASLAAAPPEATAAARADPGSGSAAAAPAASPPPRAEGPSPPRAEQKVMMTAAMLRDAKKALVAVIRGVTEDVLLKKEGLVATVKKTQSDIQSRPAPATPTEHWDTAKEELQKLKQVDEVETIAKNLSNMVAAVTSATVSDFTKLKTDADQQIVELETMVSSLRSAKQKLLEADSEHRKKLKSDAAKALYATKKASSRYTQTGCSTALGLFLDG